MKWISVEEKPEINKMVLGNWLDAFGGNYIHFGVWDGANWKNENGNLMPEPVHWMQLPEPPKTTVK